jgi:hypothetical protein
LLPLGSDFFYSSLLFKNLKIKIFRNIILPVVLIFVKIEGETMAEGV